MSYTLGDITVTITGDLEGKYFLEILEHLIQSLKQDQVLEIDPNFDK